MVQLKIQTPSKKSTLVLVYFFALIFFICGTFLSVFKSSPYLSALDIVKIIINPQASTNFIILWNLRIPRMLVGMMVGINLSVSGALLQGVLRNPLASPSIIGISSGAGFFSMFIFILFPHMFPIAPLGAFLGGTLASLIVYLLAWKNGINPTRMILAGVAVSSLFSAGSSILMVFYSDRVQNVIGWLVGGLNGVGWKEVKVLWLYTILGITMSLLFSPKLNLLLLGDEIARNLGIRIEILRVFLTLTAVLMASSAVSTVGLISFVGLIVPNLVRTLVGSNYKHLIPLSILIGGGMFTFSDSFARTLFSPIEIPVGIFTSLLGAPFFLMILRRKSL